MFTVSIIVDEVIDALADYMTPFVGTNKIIRAEVNRASPPNDSDGFIVLQEIQQTKIETPILDNDPANNLSSVTNVSNIIIQVDFYGENGGDYCNAFMMAFRSGYSYDSFPDGIKPLYLEDAIQGSFITDSKQYSRRWIIRCHLAYNPIITLPQLYADDVELNLFVNVDTEIE